MILINFTFRFRILTTPYNRVGVSAFTGKVGTAYVWVPGVSIPYKGIEVIESKKIGKRDYFLVKSHGQMNWSCVGCREYTPTEYYIVSGVLGATVSSPNSPEETLAYVEATLVELGSPGKSRKLLQEYRERFKDFV